jgi:hypothetical protein
MRETPLTGIGQERADPLAPPLTSCVIWGL